MFRKYGLLAVAGFLVVQTVTYAQYQQRQQKKLPPTPAKTITTPLPFPDVPPYTGQVRFVSGDKVESDKTDNLRQTWHIKEGRTQAVDWYKNALSSSGWKVVSTKGSVCGTKNEATVMIYVNELPLADNYRSELIMQYYRVSK